MSWYDFLTPKPPEKFHHVIDVPRTIVHLVSDPSQYQHFYECARKKKGYFVDPVRDKPAEIWIQVKKRKSGKYSPKWGYRILGHEFWHWLGKLFKLLIDPDKVYVKEEY